MVERGELLRRHLECSPCSIRLRVDLRSAPRLAIRIPSFTAVGIVVLTPVEATAPARASPAWVSRRVREELERLARLEGKSVDEVLREVLEEGIRERRVRVALKLYAEGGATLWKAARLVGISLWELIDALKRYDVKLRYGLEELEEDVREALSEEGGS